MIKQILFILYPFFLLLVGCTSVIPNMDMYNNASEAEKLDFIDQWLKNLSAKRKFNGAILIAVDGEEILMNTYGYSDVERTKPLTNQSSFRLASVSKQFTAMAIMILKEQGKLNFDDPVKNYLDNFPYKDVTIRHLLTHTSGLADYEDLVLGYKNRFSTWKFFLTGQSRENITYDGEPSRYKNLYDILSIEDVLDLVIEHRDKRQFLAGEKYQYSNTGYVLLACIIERISGQTFERFMDQEVFAPLSMNNSSVWNLNTSQGKLNDRVRGTNKNKLNDYTWLDGVAGDGAVFLSIEDFIKWDRSLSNHKLISETTFKEALTPFITKKGDTSYYGFGWALSDKGSDIDHSGSWVGASTYIYRDLNNGLLFVILDSSTNSKHAKQIRNFILKILKTLY